MPAEFVNLWLQCLMYLVLYSANPAFHSRSSRANNIFVRHLNNSKALFQRGKFALLHSVTGVTLSESEAAVPRDVLNKVSERLLKDQTDGRLDIHSSYFHYYNDLVSFHPSNTFSSLNLPSSVVRWMSIPLIVRIEKSAIFSKKSMQYSKFSNRSTMYFRKSKIPSCLRSENRVFASAIIATTSLHQLHLIYSPVRHNQPSSA
jgi:hypothetical protein